MNYADEVIESEDALYALEAQQISNKNRERLQLLRLLKTGRNLREASETVGISYRQAQRHLQLYRDSGLDALLVSRYKPNAAKLNPEQVEQVLQHKDKHRLTLVQTQAHIQTAFGKKYTLGGISAMLRRHEERGAKISK